MSFSSHALPFEPSVTAEPSRPRTSRSTNVFARLAGWFRAARPSRGDELALLSNHMRADIGLQPDTHFRAHAADRAATQTLMLMPF